MKRMKDPTPDDMGGCYAIVLLAIVGTIVGVVLNHVLK